MIYYFSGTGNSYAVAKALAENLGEGLTDISVTIREGKNTHTVKEGERLGFVFPVYAWAPPKAVTEFVKNLHLQYAAPPYLFAVCTCGSSAGRTIDLFEKALAKNGLNLDSGFSVVMPDNCITLFEPDSETEIAEKYKAAEKTLAHITRAIKQGRRNFFRVKRGNFSGILTGVVHPLFSIRGRKTKPFYVTNACIGCGLCESVCTSCCIELTAKRPIWTADTCNMCLACINRCPAKAIQYGKKTVKRGRYVHPIYQQNQMGEKTE